MNAPDPQQMQPSMPPPGPATPPPSPDTSGSGSSTGDMGNQIRMAALQTLNPQELQVMAQSVTPTFVQIMAKLFGDQAVQLLQPLIGLTNNSMAPQQPNPSVLGAFNANAQGNGNPMYQQEEGAGDPMESQSAESGECPQCGGQDPNCPTCSLPQYPTPVRF